MKGESGSKGGHVAFTGPEDFPWVAAAMLALLLIGSLALRIGSKKAEDLEP